MIKSFFSRRTLNSRMVFALIASVISSLTVFFAVYISGNYLVDNVYMSSQSVISRKNELYKDFVSYINNNQLTSQDSVAISAWSKEHDYATVLIFKDKSLNMRIHGGVAEQNPEDKKSLAEARELYGAIYTVRFSDGFAQIAISENSQTRQHSLVIIEAIGLASLIFALAMLAFTTKLAKRIISLSQETRQISSGDLNAAINISGTDEISMLASDIDTMRNSIISRMGNEQRAWQANSDLITAMSHDIRTPMTALIGYLEIMKETDFQDTERLKQFSSAAYDKSMELKDLTDELFKYFLAFGSEMKMEFEELDSTLLIDQLLCEAMFELQDMGFNVQNIPCEMSGTVTAAPLYLKRVVDNLISNIRKYADKQMPVVFVTEIKDGSLCVCISNSIKKSMNKVESTKIGIRTCEKIMANMGGSFTTVMDSNHFAAELSLPVKMMPIYEV